MIEYTDQIFKYIVNIVEIGNFCVFRLQNYSGYTIPVFLQSVSEMPERDR